MLGLPTFLSALVLACGYAFWRGGAPERTVAALFVAAWIATMIGHQPANLRYYRVDLFVAAIDLAVFLGLLWVALRADRFWPLYSAAFGLAILVAHLIKFLDPTLIRRAYSIMTLLWPYLQLAVLAAGTWRHRRRMARHGRDKPWSTFSPR